MPVLMDAKTQDALARAIAGIKTPFVPYREIETDAQMRSFCILVRDSEANVRKGNYDRTLYRWFHPDEFEEDL